MRKAVWLVSPFIFAGVFASSIFVVAQGAEIVGIQNQCLDVQGGDAANGTAVQIWPCHGGVNQQWAIKNGEIVGIGGQCLDVRGGNATDGISIQIWPCHGGANQQWAIKNGEIVGIGGQCLDVRGGSAANGTPVQIWPCHGGPNQQWALENTQPAVTVSDSRTLSGSAGEAQSTVVAPGLKPEIGTGGPILQIGCPSGRFLTSDDLTLIGSPDGPLLDGLVSGIDLNTPGEFPVQAHFDAPPHPEYYRYGTNDHDLISLSNGDVLFVTGAFSKAPLVRKPAWFDVTYRGDFGPGARSVILTWRSTDCGKTFHFVSVFDPATVGDGTCANPQLPRRTTSPGAPDRPVFDMGGTDGPLAFASEELSEIILTHQCVGYTQEKSKPYFDLDDSMPLETTLVLRSTNEGAGWSLIGALPWRYWRLGVARLANNGLGFGLSTAVQLATPVTSGYILSQTAFPTNVTWGWDPQTFYKNPNIVVDPNDLSKGYYYVYANMWASTVVASPPGSDILVLAIPSEVLLGFAQPTVHGYRVFLFNTSSNQYKETTAIVPLTQSQNSFILHLVASRVDDGPILLYWSDFDVDNKRATVRGRLVKSEWSSGDFPIRQSAAKQSFWSLMPLQRPWYGDYQTAGSYSRIVGTGPIYTRTTEHHYFPIWIEADGQRHWSEVTFSEPLLQGPPPPVLSFMGAPPLPVAMASPAGWTPIPPVATRDLARTPLEREEVEEYTQRARKLKTHE